jgi:hypothetical protein
LTHEVKEGEDREILPKCNSMKAGEAAGPSTATVEAFFSAVMESSPPSPPRSQVNETLEAV